MNEAQALAYVSASAAALAIPMTSERAQRVAAYLMRTAELAQQLDQVHMLPEDEPAEIYIPLPFPIDGVNGGDLPRVN